jgi:ABC-type Na+ efflux pump permease subunit
MVVWSGLVALVWGTAWVLYLLSPWDVEFLTYGPFTIAGDSWPSPPIMLAMFFVCVMFSLLLEPPIPRTLAHRLTLGTAIFLVYSFFVATSGLYRIYSNYARFDEADYLLRMIVLAIFVLYLVLCIVMVHRDQVYVCVRVWRDIRF